MEKKKEHLILGFYDYTVVLTYLSLLISVGGIFLSVNGRHRTAVAALALSGLCDMFDGKIARTKKDRTIDETRFGVQIDSLCDMVCFGAAPAVLCYDMGMQRPAGMLILMFFVLAGLIRLANYNVMTEKHESCSEECGSYYHGLPITSIAVVLPLVMMCRPFLRSNFLFALHITMLTVAILYIINFKFRKPKNATLTILVIIVAAAVLKILHLY